jgi:hypothetical protein
MAVEPRKGTLAVSAMFLVIVAASMIYWRRFSTFLVIGMVGIDDREEFHLSGLIYMCLSTVHTGNRPIFKSFKCSQDKDTPLLLPAEKSYCLLAHISDPAMWRHPERKSAMPLTTAKINLQPMG